ncbi:MAG: hypothetical protein U9R25_02375 [Chloroflexota bacterium]|nr:hypothetical protein [Chloroflexota bacterium]
MATPKPEREVPASAVTPEPAATEEPMVTPAIATEVAVVELALTGPASERRAELSGLAWYGDTLVLLPQYPDLYDGVFALSKADILANLDSRSSEPLTPMQIPLLAPGLVALPGYEGTEAIGFHGSNVYVTVEARLGSGMLGYLIRGDAAPDLSQLRLDVASAVSIEPQARIGNFSDETLVVGDNLVATVYEANGANVNPQPAAHLFDSGLQDRGTLVFPNVEYRVTDATALDDRDRFWAINFFFPGDVNKIDPAPDPLVIRYGEGYSHGRNIAVERLLEFEVADDGIALVERPPLQLQLLGDMSARNWEGIVRLDDRGFLLVTDTYPRTMLGFVPWP